VGQSAAFSESVNPEGVSIYDSAQELKDDFANLYLG